MATDDWSERIADLQRRGRRMAKEYRRRGKSFITKALAPAMVYPGDKIQLSAAVIKLDWKMAAKLEMVEAAKDILTKSSILGSLDPALSTILTAVIEEKGLYQHNIGEFFLLYGQFEQKYGVFSGKKTLEKMEALIQEKKKFLKLYKDYDKETLVPLPYAVRNILSHSKNPNKLDEKGKDIENSIELLKLWLK